MVVGGFEAVLNQHSASRYVLSSPIATEPLALPFNSRCGGARAAVVGAGRRGARVEVGPSREEVSMGKAEVRGRGSGPPIADYRTKTGRHQAKIGKVERTETANKAIARKQAFPWQKLVLIMISFSAFCGLLYMYLMYVLSEDEEDEELAALEAAAAAARAAKQASEKATT